MGDTIFKYWHQECRKLFDNNAEWFSQKQARLEANIKIEQDKHPRVIVSHAFKTLRESKGKKEASVTGFTLNPEGDDPTFSLTFDGLPPLFHVQRCAISDINGSLVIFDFPVAAVRKAWRAGEWVVGLTDREDSRWSGVPSGS